MAAPDPESELLIRQIHRELNGLTRSRRTRPEPGEFVRKSKLGQARERETPSCSTDHRSGSRDDDSKSAGQSEDIDNLGKRHKGARSMHACMLTSSMAQALIVTICAAPLKAAPVCNDCHTHAPEPLHTCSHKHNIPFIQLPCMMCGFDLVQAQVRVRTTNAPKSTHVAAALHARK